MSVKIPGSVLKAIESIRQSGITNMLDRNKVLELLETFEEDAAAEWIREDKGRYSRLIFEGPEEVEG